MSHNVPTDIKQEIASAAARMVVEEGLEYGAAKRRAAKQLGLTMRSALPSNDDIEREVRDYIAIFCAESQSQELAELRALALMWMQRLQAFRPHLGGAVWHGTATRLSDIFIQLFCDDAKSAEIALINHNVRYQPSTIVGFHGDNVEVLSLHCPCPALHCEIGVHLLVYDYNDLRGALKPDSQGRRPRGDIAAVQALLTHI